MITLRPMYERVIVEREIVAEQTESGLYIPESAKEKPMRGTVVATGPGKYFDNGTVRPMSVKVGDQILFGKYAGSQVTVNGKEVLLLLEDDIFSVIEESTEAPLP